MKFMIGCNYWASHAGTDMWRDFDAEIIENDIKTLRSYGMEYLRVFPNWRDFQPVFARRSSPQRFSRYAIEGDELNDGGYFLDRKMMDHFSTFLDICEKYDVKLIVGILTGFMSGAALIPPALDGENLVTSPVAHYLEQLYITGFVKEFSDRSSIVAWDLGNECNNFYSGTRFETASWMGMVANTIRAADPTRPIVTGMNASNVEGSWLIQDQAQFCEILTSRPYPYWYPHPRIDESLSVRALMFPTIASKIAEGIGKKPCLVEEVGTMGPTVLSDENSAHFARVNLFSSWANGFPGLLWWCAHEQTELNIFPYSDQMVERELGLLRCDFTPKPALLEMNSFSKWLETLDFELPPAKKDAVCILTRDQDQSGIGYMTGVLSRLAGINCGFCYSELGIPESDLYIMPSYKGAKVMHKSRYADLRKRIFEGADLYISAANGILAEFESLTGLRLLDSYVYAERGTAVVNGKEISFTTERTFLLEPVGAEVLAYDNKGNPFCTCYKYGKGRVFFVNAPIEAGLLAKHNAFSGNEKAVYEAISEKVRAAYPVKVLGQDIVMTYHPAEDGGYVVLLNHYKDEKRFTLELDAGYAVDKVYYGDLNAVKAFDACVVKLKKSQQ